MKAIRDEQDRQAAEAAAKEAAEAKTKAKSKVAKIHGRELAKQSKKLPELTPERIEAVRQAFGFMLGVCDGAFLRDGQGFNKPDAMIAHCLLTTGLETSEEVEAGYMILSRYYRQLHQDFPILFGN